MTNLTISAHDLTYRYGDLTAVDHINFDVAEGEVLGFFGAEWSRQDHCRCAC